MMKKFTLMNPSVGGAVVAATMVACGGATSDTGVTNPSEGGAGNEPEDVETTGQPSRTHADSPAACTVEGETREATSAEEGTTCECSSVTLYDDNGQSRDVLGWLCYGPSDSDPPAGGARGAPPAKCTDFLTQPGSEGCLAVWSACSDGHSYMVSCQDECWCLVDSEFTVPLPPNASCPNSLSDVNDLCGWALEGTEGGSGG